MPDCMKDYQKEQEERWDAKKKATPLPTAPPVSEPAPSQKTKMDTQMLTQFGDDLHALCEEGMDYHQAIQQAAMVNFDCDPTMLALDVDPDPCPSFMLFH